MKKTIFKLFTVAVAAVMTATSFVGCGETGYTKNNTEYYFGASGPLSGGAAVYGEAVKNGADEIDMVINVGLLKDKAYGAIVDEISAIKGACQGHNLKVILETDLLTQDEIKKACELCIEAKADLVKTSTGFVKNGVGAKAEDVAIMFNTVKDAGMQVKASGGIRDKEAALKMIEAGAVRLGTSSGVKIVS